MRSSGAHLFHSSAAILLTAILIGASCPNQTAHARSAHQPASAAAALSSNAIAVVDRIMVNDSAQFSATAEDIELIRAGQQTAGGLEIGTPLYANDTIRTKDNDQVVLRFPSESPDTLNVVYLDPNTEVVIGSLCLRSGRILAWVGINFNICFRNKTLAVKGTEFDMRATDQGSAKVAVLAGQVDVVQDAPITNRKMVVPVRRKMEVTLAADDEVTARPLSEDEGRNVVDYWSNRMINVERSPQLKDSEFLNYTSDTSRNQAFIGARFDAIWNDNPRSLETIGKIYNDWGQGDRASALLAKAARRDPTLLASKSFDANRAEADRLSGKYDSAVSHVLAALRNDEKYSDAYYVMATIRLDQEKRFNNPAYAEHARGLLAKAVQSGSTPGLIDKGKAEQELDALIQKQGKEFLSEQNQWVSNERWWREKKEPAGVLYRGTIDLPELKQADVDISGPASLYIVGNQFKLKTNSQVLTGTIVGNTSQGSTAVALHVDDPRLTGISTTGINLSLRSEGRYGELVLEPIGRAKANVKMEFKRTDGPM